MLMSSLLMLVLSICLYFFGDPSYSERNLIVPAILQIVLFIITLNLIRNREEFKKIALIFAAVSFFESIIVIGQFLYSNTGFGFEKMIEDQYSRYLVSGSMGNPNNSAALIGLLSSAVTVFLVLNGKKNIAYIYIFLVFPALFITLSRTMMLYLFFNLIAVFVHQSSSAFDYKISHKFKLASILAIATIVFVTYSLFERFSDSDTILRSINRLGSIGNIANDESMHFRWIVVNRFFENIFNLGYGSFSDLNYFRYFKSDDGLLMKINPHSYIVEYSFLFGYLGLFVVGFIFSYSIFGLLRSNIELPFKILFIFGILFIQAVPSSLLTSIYFFIPFIYVAALNRFNWRVEK